MNIDTYQKECLTRQDVVTITGHTLNYKGNEVFGIVGAIFRELNKVSERSLYYYLVRLKKNVDVDLHPHFYFDINGTKFFTNRILEFRKGGSPSPKNVLLPQKSLNKADQPQNVKSRVLESPRQAKIDWLKQMKWDFVATLNYSTCRTVKKARSHCEKFTTRLAQSFPGSTTTVFFVTEQNESRDGYHSHLCISVDRAHLKVVETVIQKKMKSVGSQINFVEPFDKEKGFDHFRYLTKQMNRDEFDWDILQEQREGN